MMVRVLVTGDRNFDCMELAREVLEKVMSKHGEEITLVHGCSGGVDASFAKEARELGLEVEGHFANWRDGGLSAGPMRNQEMVDAGADFCIAVHSAIAWSKGTKDCVSRCLKAGIPVFLFTGKNTSYTRVLPEHLAKKGKDAKRDDHDDREAHAAHRGRSQGDDPGDGQGR